MSYLDEATVALVRPYAITQGRTRPRRHITIEALIGTTVHGRVVADQRYGVAYRHEQYHVAQIANLCRFRVQSLGEIAARLRMPLGVTRVIVADMAGRGLVTIHEPLPFDATSDPALERILVGLRAL